MSKNVEKEVWVVEVKSTRYDGECATYHVFAHSAGQAEKRAMSLAKADDGLSAKSALYVASARFDHYVQ